MKSIPVIDWAQQALPDAWPDRLDLRKPWNLARFLKAIVWDKPSPVRLPSGLVGAERIPRYILQEFHNLPNGNYSKKVTRGYAKGFDLMMLGQLHRARAELAQRIGPVSRALDIGCGAGHTAGALARAGVQEVWGLDPSPYLLQYAASLYPEVRFCQGVAEQLHFPDASFDAASACFVFHEIPPRYGDQALTELQRILRPGATLALIEPDALHMRGNIADVWRNLGLRGLYFKLMARRVHEPFVDSWHKRDKRAWLAEHGFELLEDRQGCPYQFLVARRL